jgi:hypothetical protein
MQTQCFEFVRGEEREGLKSVSLKLKAFGIAVQQFISQPSNHEDHPPHGFLL